MTNDKRMLAEHDLRWGIEHHHGPRVIVCNDRKLRHKIWAEQIRSIIASGVAAESIMLITHNDEDTEDIKIRLQRFRRKVFTKVWVGTFDDFAHQMIEKTYDKPDLDKIIAADNEEKCFQKIDGPRNFMDEGREFPYIYITEADAVSAMQSVKDEFIRVNMRKKSTNFIHRIEADEILRYSTALNYRYGALYEHYKTSNENYSQRVKEFYDQIYMAYRQRIGLRSVDPFRCLAMVHYAIRSDETINSAPITHLMIDGFEQCSPLQFLLYHGIIADTPYRDICVTVQSQTAATPMLNLFSQKFPLVCTTVLTREKPLQREYRSRLPRHREAMCKAMAEQIAYLIDSNAEAGNILVLTDSNSTTSRVKELLVKRRTKNLSKMWIGTPLAIFARLVRLFVSPNDFLIIDNEERDAMLAALVAENGLPSDIYTPEALLGSNSVADVPAETFSQNCRLILRSYRQQLHKQNKKDFDGIEIDMFFLLSHGITFGFQHFVVGDSACLTPRQTKIMKEIYEQEGRIIHKFTANK